MANPWKNTFKVMPANDQVVWIRVPYYYGPPIKATFKTSVSPFYDGHGFIANTGPDDWIPFYMVPRWKPL